HLRRLRILRQLLLLCFQLSQESLGVVDRHLETFLIRCACNGVLAVAEDATEFWHNLDQLLLLRVTLNNKSFSLRLQLRYSRLEDTMAKIRDGAINALGDEQQTLR
ncbi:hypothetical protein PMAYCL1PPCAC_28631, partial [Pristionchus mayeri]